MSFVTWMIDSLASEDVIDLYFILSDLFDINQTPAELAELAHYDSVTSGTEFDINPNVPIGKQVF